MTQVYIISTGNSFAAFEEEINKWIEEIGKNNSNFEVIDIKFKVQETLSIKVAYIIYKK